MQKTNFIFSESFVQKLIDFSGGSIPADSLEIVISALQKECDRYYFTSSSEANLLRIFSAMYDKSLFISELSKYPHHIEIVIAIAASSNYLTDIVVRNPEYLYQVFDQTYLTQPLIYEILRNEISSGLSKFKSLTAKLNYLRQVKKRFTLKLGVNDILRFEELKSITQQLSFLAKGINAELFDLCHTEILNKYKLKIESTKYCMCSLGKLGGNELNYSSDVDMILFYDENLTLNEIKKEYQEILCEAALLYIKSSTAITDRGYIYRVDFRLRPDGKYSPLCKAINDYTKYYETRGEDWERQMLIKLDFVCGNLPLYQKFYKFLQPYIYPSSFSSSLKEQIKKMKTNIERKNKEKEDIKLFQGGIRDIEFSVQALQLLNGGRFKDIRTGNSLDAIKFLSARDLLKENEEIIFTEAYIFYRRIEHFLQLMNDTQTHTLPAEGDMLNKLVNYMGFSLPDEFKQQLDTYRTKVRKIYDDILFTENISEILSGIMFSDKTRVERNLNYLRNGTGLSGQKGFDARTINLFGKIEPFLAHYLKNSSSPDRTLDNFVKVIQNSSFPSIWFNEFTNEKFFELFLEICEFSQRAIDLLSADKILEEFFLSRRIFIKNPESELNTYTTNQILFLLSVQFGLKLIDPMKVSEILSSYVELKIKETLMKLNMDQICFIGAMGSFGSRAMNFSSDIDLIIVVDDVNKYKNVQSDFQNFVSQIQKVLKPFEVDFRLRPEGKKSPLVADIVNYKKYLIDRARVWEFQSLLKLRFITGSKELFSVLKESILDSVKNINEATSKKEIIKMFASVQKELVINQNSFNIKKQKGGLLNIDFILQSIAMSSIEFYSECNGKNIQEIIAYLSNNGFNELDILESNYKYLRKIEFAIQNIFNTTTVNIPTDPAKKLIINRFLNEENGIDKIISSIIKSNNNFTEKYIGN